MSNNKKYSFLLIKHSKQIFNYENRFIGWYNVPITQYCIDNSYKIGNKLIEHNLLPNIIYCSDLNRTIYSSYVIRNKLKKNIPIIKSWKLNEKYYGELEGVPKKYVQKIYGDNSLKNLESDYITKLPKIKDFLYYNNYSYYENSYVNDRESNKNIQDRLLPYYKNDILDTIKENKLPLIFTHKYTARVFMKYLLNLNDDDFLNYNYPNNKILLINLDNKFKYIDHNEIEY